MTSLFWLCNYVPHWMFRPLDILFEYWIKHVTVGHLGVVYRFCTRILYRGVPGFANDCPCGVIWRGWTACPCMLVPFGESNLKWQWVCKFGIVKTTFHYFYSRFYMYTLMLHNIMILYFHLPYFHVSSSALIFTKLPDSLLLHSRNLDTSYVASHW